MRRRIENLSSDFENAVAIAITTIDGMQQYSSSFLEANFVTANVLLGDKLHEVFCATQGLIFSDPDLGAMAYEDFLDLIYLTSERLGTRHDEFNNLAERYLHTHYALGRLSVKVYKDNDMEQRVGELCPV